MKVYEPMPLEPSNDRDLDVFEYWIEYVDMHERHYFMRNIPDDMNFTCVLFRCGHRD